MLTVTDSCRTLSKLKYGPIFILTRMQPWKKSLLFSHLDCCRRKNEQEVSFRSTEQNLALFTSLKVICSHLSRASAHLLSPGVITWNGKHQGFAWAFSIKLLANLQCNIFSYLMIIWWWETCRVKAWLLCEQTIQQYVQYYLWNVFQYLCD